jgi:hypothetical protein
MALEGLEVSSEDGRLEWSAVRGSGATLALDLTFVLPKGPR